ncbi:DUF2512 family protein [Fictibacillus iocasae]|uniref:DUF2512 family protein n=1 Tax=Fictibacillus iocasae TaxID=2715437 RepID=A0ABW2NTH5_9BACL
MQSLLIKIIGIPTLLIVATFMFKSVHITSPWSYAIITLVLAPIGVLMEYIFIPRITYGRTVAADFIVTFFLVLGLCLALPGAEVTIWGAFLVTLLLTGMEALIHKHLVADHREHSYH